MKNSADLVPIQAALNGNFSQFQLGNGLRVGIENIQTNTTSAKLAVSHSTSDETLDQAGLAHFTEHMIMFGSFGPFSPETCDKIRQRLGWYIPFTETDKTYFPAGIMPSDINVLLKYLASAVFNPRFDGPRLGQERQRILREIADDRGSSLNRDIELYNAALFGNHPYALEILGKRKSVRSVTPDDLLTFHSRGYFAKNMTLILAGPLPQNIEELIRKNFEDRPSGDTPRSPIPQLSSLEKQVIMYRYAPDLLDHESPEESSATVYLGVIAVPSSARERIAISLLWHMLYNYTTSRLFQKISREETFAYDLDKGIDVFDLKGYLEIQVPVRSTAQDKAIDAIFGEFCKLQEYPPTKNELDIAYNNLVFKTAYQLERSKHHVRMIERLLQTGLIPSDQLGILKSLAPEELQEAARKFLPSSRQDGKYVLMVRDPLLGKDRTV